MAPVYGGSAGIVLVPYSLQLEMMDRSNYGRTASKTNGIASLHYTAVEKVVNHTTNLVYFLDKNNGVL